MGTELDCLLQTIKDHSCNPNRWPRSPKGCLENELLHAEKLSSTFTVLISDGVEEVCPTSLALLLNRMLTRIDDLEAEIEELKNRETWR
jgi:hypothetical protein